MGANPTSHFVDSRFVLEFRISSESLEPLNDFLAYLVRHFLNRTIVFYGAPLAQRPKQPLSSPNCSAGPAHIKPCRWVLDFILRMFQDNCNRDYFQCNRNRLSDHLYMVKERLGTPGLDAGAYE